jgi:DNA-binding LacI/PurR family transcriptional regulator
MKRRILEAAWEKGLILNSNIGLMVPESVSEADFLYYPALSGIIQHCMMFEYGLLNSSFGDDASNPDIPDFLLKRKVSGMLFLDRMPANIRDFLIDEKIPYVLMNPSSGPMEKDCVLFNDYDAMTELLEYLRQKGYDEYVYVSIASSTAYSQNVLKSFKDFIKMNSFKSSIILAKPAEEQNTFDELNRKIRKAQKSTVFITPSRLFTIKLLALFEANGKSAPDNIGIVGSNLLADYYIPRLTTVHYPFLEMGGIAVEMLREKLAARQFNVDSETVNVKIIKNQSTGGEIKNEKPN